MGTLNETVRKVVFSYAASGLNLRTYALSNEEQGIYAVNVVDWPERRRHAGVVVIARVEGDKVVIDEDLTDRPLVDALVESGIPREKVVLAYAGESTTNEPLSKQKGGP